MSTVRTRPPSLKKPSPWGKIAPLVPVLVVAIVALVIAVPAAIDSQPSLDGSPAPSAPSGPREDPPTGGSGGSPGASPRTRAIMRDCRAQLGDVPACASLARDDFLRERYVACRVDGLPAWRCLGLPAP